MRNTDLLLEASVAEEVGKEAERAMADAAAAAADKQALLAELAVEKQRLERLQLIAQEHEEVLKNFFLLCSWLRS